VPKVRTTMRPDQVIEVSDIEARDLARQGLLVSDGVPSAPASTPVPTPGPAAKKAALAATREG